MKIKHILLPLIALSLCGCNKTDRLYKLNAYDHANFNSNYYLKEDTKDFKYTEVNETPLELAANNNLEGLHKEDVGEYVWEDAPKNRKEKLWGYHNNLGLVNEKFKKGAISKLYDGRVRCDGLYQKSRAQLDKIGYSAMFPMTLSRADYFAFSCRGATTLSISLKEKLEMNFKISFFTIDEANVGSYVKHVYKLNGIKIETDNYSQTTLVSFYFPKEDNFVIKNTVAMSFEWECIDSKMEEYNLTDDRTDLDEGKSRLALMLYEVFLGNSIWY